MSDPFSNKEYGDYFEALSRRVGEEKTPSSYTPQPRNPVAPKAKKRRKIRIRPAFLAAMSLTVVLILVFTVLLSAAAKPKKEEEKPEAVAVETDVPEPVKKERISFKEAENMQEAPADNDAESMIIINSDTCEIIAEREAKKKMYPASTTKIMTVLVAAEQTENFDDTFTMTQDITDAMYIAEATVAGFSVNEEVTITDLLYGTILSSGGDAAIGLARKIAGSEEAFVRLMNRKAEEMGLENTHFTNVTGLHDPEHYTTAYDMAVILKSALEIPICKEVLSTYIHVTNRTPQHPEGIKLHATLFDMMYGTEPETATILGGKTGFVNESGYCIASYGANNETKTEYIVVTMKNSGRWPAVHGQIAIYKQFAK